jgi:hypothetical protein
MTIDNAATVGTTKPVGETSDGYHTFNELYEHRTALFAALIAIWMSEGWANDTNYGSTETCQANVPACWKSKLHADGTMFPDYFIVGIRLAHGDISYHVNQKYWDDFVCPEVATAPVWDGHTPNDVVERLFSLTRAVSKRT